MEEKLVKISLNGNIGGVFQLTATYYQDDVNDNKVFINNKRNKYNNIALKEIINKTSENGEIESYFICRYDDLQNRKMINDLIQQLNENCKNSLSYIKEQIEEKIKNIQPISEETITNKIYSFNDGYCHKYAEELKDILKEEIKKYGNEQINKQDIKEEIKGQLLQQWKLYLELNSKDIDTIINSIKVIRKQGDLYFFDNKEQYDSFIKGSLQNLTNSTYQTFLFDFQFK